MHAARASLIAAVLTSICAWLTPVSAYAEAKPQAKDAAIVIELWGLKDGVTTAEPNIKVLDQRDDFWRLLSVLGGDKAPLEEQEYFNQAHCTCGDENLVRVAFRANATTLQNNFKGELEIYSGQDCADKNSQNFTTRCTLVDRFTTLEMLRGTEQVRFYDAEQIMVPGCGSTEQTGHLWALVVNRDGDPTKTAVESHKDFDVDTRSPEPVAGFSAEPGEDGIYLSWEVTSTTATDVWYYQVLCSRADNTALLPKPSDDPLYQFACQGSVTPPPVADAGVPDASVPDAAPGTPDAAPPRPDARPVPDAAPPLTAADLNPMFICGSPQRTDSHFQVNIPSSLGLTRQDKIKVQLVAIDKHHNLTASTVLESHLEPVHDFWEVYDDANGSAEGGYCFVATAAYGDYDHPFVLVLRDFRDHTLAQFGAGRAFIAWYYRNSPPLADFIREHAVARVAAQVLLWPVVILAGTWEYTTALDKLVLFALLAFVMVRRRRRKLARRAMTQLEETSQMQTPIEPALAPTRGKRALAAAAASVAVLLGTVHVASAQAIYDDDLDQEERAPVSQWVFELKFGPYTPDIDSEFNVEKGPYQVTFGDPESGATDGLMTQIEVDRFFLFPGGQLGAAFGMGYMQKWAHAFAEDDMGNPIYSMRSTTDKTTFRLVPLYVGAVYRYTQLADRTVIPLVPYAKLGLAYDLWWITKGNGEVSKTDKGGEAKGGTLGWQGALGLSFRADAIDPGAARNMQTEMGVEHVGFFAEVSYANVNGLGMSHKLRVGDLTWLAGINFEF